MADLIYREDAKDFVRYAYNKGLNPIEYLNKIPTADVVDVVRCKDCRHRDPEDRKCDSGEMERQGCVFPVDDDYFCAYGKRCDS